MWKNKMQKFASENTLLSQEGTFKMYIESVKDVTVKGREKTVINFIVFGGEHDGLSMAKFMDSESSFDLRFLYMLGIACGVDTDAIKNDGIEPSDFIGFKIIAEIKRNKDGYLNIVTASSPND